MWRPAGANRRGLASGTARAARSRSRCRRTYVPRPSVSRTRKTTVKAPSLRSPKWRSRIVRARSESVPGTENSFERSELNRVNAKAPASSTTSHPTRIGQRNRSTNRVQRYINMEIDYGPFQRRIQFAEQVDPAGARAEYKRGLLTVSLPVAEREPAQEKVSIQIARSK